MSRELIVQAGITLLYAAFNGALHWAVHRGVDRAQPRCKNKVVVGFELASLIQFVCWVPLLFWPRVNPWLLFSIMNGRELYDLVLFALDKRHAFPVWYKKFLYHHHAISISSRVAGALIVSWLLGPEYVRPAMQCLFAYYICSLFLVAPVPLNRLYFDRMSPRIKVRANVITYVLARAAHLSVVICGLVLFSTLPGLTRAIAWATLVSGYLANEYPSATSGFWKLLALTDSSQSQEGERDALCHLGDTASN